MIRARVRNASSLRPAGWPIPVNAHLRQHKQKVKRNRTDLEGCKADEDACGEEAESDDQPDDAPH